MPATVTIVPACITGLTMAHATAYQLGAHLLSLSNKADGDHRNDIDNFYQLLVKATVKDQQQDAIRLGIVSHGAQWLMYVVQNAASEDEPAEMAKAREEIFTALKDALSRVEQPA